MKFKEEVFLNSDFSSRLLAFLQEYDCVRNIETVSLVETWLHQKAYESILYFLHPSAVEWSIPFSMHTFISMSPQELVFWQEYCIKLSALLDEKKLLYQEFQKFFNLENKI